MKQALIKLCIVAIATASIVIASPAYATSEKQLAASVDGSHPANSALTLKNASTSACQVADTANGTVAITKVVQDGQAITPTPMNVSFVEGLDFTLPTLLKTLNPGDSTVIPLRTTKVGEQVGLQSIAWSPGGGTIGLLYSVKPDRPVQMELNYTVPVDAPTGAPLCSTVFVSTTPDGSSWLPFIVGVGIFLGFIVLIVVLWLLLKRRRKKPVVAAMLFASVAVLLSGLSHPVSAQVTVPDSVRSEWGACMGTLEANRDITGPILDLINDPNVHIVIDPVDNGGTEAKDPWPDGSYHIDWDLHDGHRFAGTGGYEDPCTSMYHELYHVRDMHDGTLSRDDCAGSGIETQEVMATRAQNELRVRLGMPARSHYGRRALPVGDCRALSPPLCHTPTCSMSIGEPHLLTFDGRYYDFQGAGEFILARAKENNFEVQVRQQQWQESRSVAVNTAIAIKIGDHILQITPDGYRLSLLVDGKPRSNETAKVSDDVSVTAFDATRLDLATSDGTVVSVSLLGDYGLNVAVGPSESLKNKTDGLLGNFNGDPEDDLRLQGKNITVKDDFEQLYPQYSDSWRVIDQTSLFTYAAGKSTASYTNRAFPYENPNVQNLAGYGAAEKICTQFGVVDDAMLKSCAMDVALTGRPEFARSFLYYRMTDIDQNGNQTGAIVPDGHTVTAAIVKPGASANFTFNGTKDQRLFVRATHATIPNQCSPIAVLGPGGSVVGSGCLTNGYGIIDTMILPENGKYSLQVKPSDTAMGKVILQLTTASLITKTLNLGDTVDLLFSKPGDEAEIRFDASAGKKLYVDISKSTLPGQCGGFSLEMPNGDQVNGCLGDEKGSLQEEGVIAPVDGEYILHLNPSEANTGSATVRIHE